MSNSNSAFAPPFNNQSSRVFKNPMSAWEERTTLVKREIEAERAASEAKTAKLRALRLEKEAADREKSAETSENLPAAKSQKRTRRISIT